MQPGTSIWLNTPDMPFVMVLAALRFARAHFAWMHDGTEEDYARHTVPGRYLGVYTFGYGGDVYVRVISVSISAVHSIRSDQRIICEDTGEWMEALMEYKEVMRGNEGVL